MRALNPASRHVLPLRGDCLFAGAIAVCSPDFSRLAAMAFPTERCAIEQLCECRVRGVWLIVLTGPFRTRRTVAHSVQIRGRSCKLVEIPMAAYVYPRVRYVKALSGNAKKQFRRPIRSTEVRRSGRVDLGDGLLHVHAHDDRRDRVGRQRS